MLPLFFMDHPVVLFDGVCNFCNGTVHFIIRQDKKNIFKFAPLQSPKGQELVQQYLLPANKTDSIILIENGVAYTKSTAALKLANRFPWYWKWTQLLWIVPAFLRNAVYDLIAQNRYKWFGKKDECMIPTGKTKEKFLY